MDAGEWQQLSVDRRSTPPGLTEEQFRSWMSGQRIFISSVMDEEMNPDRAALRTWVDSWGGVPIMWETLVPRDERAVHAYLAGVDQSQIFVLLLGSRYGTPDARGASPIYQEYERACEIGLPRLVLKRTNVGTRIPMLADWIQGMYNELSIANYETPPQLTTTLEQRLRETASAQETPWVKLGSAVFPGKIRQSYGGGQIRFAITAELTDRSVLDALVPRNAWDRVNVDRLTFGDSTFPVTQVEVDVTNQVMRSTEIQIRCQANPQHRDTGRFGVGGMSFVEGSRQIGPAEQVGIWAEYALFGKEPPQRGSAGIFGMMVPTGPTLQDILGRERARGWTAEGLTRLFIVESLVKRFGGRFNRLEVGPAIASGIPVFAAFRPDGFDEAVGEVRGTLPLPE